MCIVLAPFHHVLRCGTLSNLPEEFGIPGLKSHMKTRQTPLMDKTKVIQRFLAQGPSAGVARDPLNGGKVPVEVPEDLDEGVDILDEAVGVSQEHGTHMGPIETAGCVDILQDLHHRASLKGRILVHGAEGALVPWTSAGDPEQEAIGLTGRTIRGVVVEHVQFPLSIIPLWITTI
jgi:hypothetical protein